MNDSLQKHYDSAFAENDGEIYGVMSKFDVAAHGRKLEILSQLILPDLKNATVLDYGVGSWGFGCILNRLKECKVGIGIDVSAVAISLSDKVSSADPALANTTVKYMTSNGYVIDLPDESVDLIFCGECIEHIEETTAFLSELYRVLKTDGMAIFTTPNASPWLYRQFNLKWCMGFEHVALMDYATFRSELERFFEIDEVYGFNHSLHPELDWQLGEGFITEWSRLCHDNPEDATSMIATVRKVDPNLYRKQKVLVVESDALPSASPTLALELETGVFGAAVETGNSFAIEVPAGMTRCQLVFWAHAWSGIAEIVNGDETRQVDLYSPTAGCWRESIDVASGQIIVRPTGGKAVKSSGSQVILYRAVFGGEV
jgi:SAM-dependent methyltransferase